MDMDELEKISKSTWDCEEIIIERLKALGADGLCNEDCGCGLDDLCPCDSCCFRCLAAKKIKNPDSSDSDCPEIFVPINDFRKDKK